MGLDRLLTAAESETTIDPGISQGTHFIHEHNFDGPIFQILGPKC